MYRLSAQRRMTGASPSQTTQICAYSVAYPPKAVERAVCVRVSLSQSRAWQSVRRSTHIEVSTEGRYQSVCAAASQRRRHAVTDAVLSCSTRSARAGGGTIPPPSAVPRGASRTPSRRRNGTLKVPPSEFAPAHAGASLMLPLPLVDKSSAQRVRRVRAPQSPLAKLSACPLPREAFAGSRCRRRRRHPHPAERTGAE